MKELSHYTDAINELCRVYEVRTLYVFGSVLTAAFGDDSDIDLVVDFEPIPLERYADNYFNFKYALQNVLNREVDLLEEPAIRNPFFKKALEQQRQLIYG